VLVLLLRRASGSRVFVSDINPFRLEKALEFGVTDVINSLAANPVEVIMDKTDQMGVDRSFEAVGSKTSLLQALRALKKGGTATLLGIFEDPDVIVPVNLFVQREISLAGSQGYCWDFQDSLTLLKNGVVDLKPLITHRLPLNELHQGFEILTNPKMASIKVVITME